MNKFYQRRSSTHLWVYILLLMVSLLYGTAAPMTAQTEAPTPSVTASPSITPIPPDFTPSATPTPTITPTSIPTLDVPSIGGQARITRENADQIGKLRSWQPFGEQGRINGLTFGLNAGQLIMVGNASIELSSPLQVWDISGQAIELLENDFEAIPSPPVGLTGLRLSHDRNRLIVFSEVGLVWDTRTGYLIGSISQYGANTGTISEGNNTLFVANELGLVGIWAIPDLMNLPSDVKVIDPDGTLLTAFQLDAAIAQLEYIDATGQLFVLTADARLYAITPFDYDATMYEEILQPPDSRQALPIFNGLNGGPRMAHGVSGSLLAFAGRFQDVVLVDPLSREIVNHIPLASPLACLFSSPDGRLLIVAEWGMNTYLRVLDAVTLEDLGRIETGQSVVGCTINAEGNLIATWDTEGNASLWGVP
jgi:hypothetical protein